MRSADRDQANDYDSFAEMFSAETENSLVNAYYERPAMLALAGDVTGRRTLDAGCGSGPLSAALRDRGAVGGVADRPQVRAEPGHGEAVVSEGGGEGEVRVVMAQETGVRSADRPWTGPFSSLVGV